MQAAPLLKTRFAVSLMTDRRLTPLQRKLYGVKAVRQTLQGLIEERSGIPITGYKRMWNSIIKDNIISRLTDDQIRDVLYYVLQCEDLPEEDRATIEKILKLI